VEKFTCPKDKGQAFLYDTEMPRLAVRVTRAGCKAYTFETRLRGSTMRLTIGEPSSMTLEDARAEVARLKILTKRGIDPREDDKRKRQAAEAEEASRRIAEMPALEVWAEYCAERRPAWGERHHADHLSFVQPGGEPRTRGKGKTQPGALRDLLLLPLAALTPEAVTTWAKRHATARPTVARLGLRLLAAFVNWCRENPDYRPVLPSENPAKSRKAREALGPAKAKKDALQRQQLRPWFEAVYQQNPVISAYLQTLLLTGARPGELLALGWKDVDFEWRSLTIRDKVEGQRDIPLTPYVARLLADLPRPGLYVFSTFRGDGPIASPNHALNRVCIAAGVPPVTLHGLRRSFKSLGEWLTIPPGILAQIMGHKPSATVERHYVVRPLDLLRMWHSSLEGWILEQARSPQPSGEQCAKNSALIASLHAMMRDEWPSSRRGA
jgi:integrase